MTSVHKTSKNSWNRKEELFQLVFNGCIILFLDRSVGIGVVFFWRMSDYYIKMCSQQTWKQCDFFSSSFFFLSLFHFFFRIGLKLNLIHFTVKWSPRRNSVWNGEIWHNFLLSTHPFSEWTDQITTQIYIKRGWMCVYAFKWTHE